MSPAPTRVQFTMPDTRFVWISHAANMMAALANSSPSQIGSLVGSGGGSRVTLMV